MQSPMFRFYIIVLFSCIASTSVKAQIEEAFPASTVSYKVVQDDPKDLNHLWIHIQPFTVDAMRMNTAIGSGLDITYLPIPKLELKGGIRGNLINAFDLQRAAANRNASITTQESKREQGKMVLTNSFSRFYNAEIVGTYAFLDVLKDGTSKIILADQAIPGNTAMVEKIEVNAKVRQIIGARLGFNTMATTASLQNALEDQNVVLKGDKGTIIDPKGTSTTNGFRTANNNNLLYSNFSSTGIYLGASIQKIKNVTIKTERNGILANNTILTYYADLILNPWTSLENIEARNVGKEGSETFDSSPLKLNKFGGRAGFELRYNQASLISIGAEVGYRPSISGQGTYAVLKLSFPTFSFGASSQKVATNVGKTQSLSQ
jgi:hypothetical protein